VSGESLPSAEDDRSNWSVSLVVSSRISVVGLFLLIPLVVTTIFLWNRRFLKSRNYSETRATTDCDEYTPLTSSFTENKEYIRIRKKGHNSRTIRPGLTKMTNAHLHVNGNMGSKFHLDNLVTVGRVWDTAFHQNDQPTFCRLQYISPYL